MVGTFVLSIDVELAWGFIERAKIDNQLLDAAGKVRQILTPLLQLIDRYQIPVTWAILGHLFLDSCHCEEMPHPDMPRPNYSWFKGDWYKYDPCSDVARAPLWYGRDIVERILQFADSCSAEQEIGCHSFSHPMFGEPGCSEEVARAEIDKSLEVMKDFGIKPSTFVFPVASVGHVHLLKEKEFTSFCSGIPKRLAHPSLEKSASNLVRKYSSLGVEFFSYYFHSYPPVVMPREISPGFCEVPRSLCFNKKKNISMSLVSLKAKKGIKKAIELNKCFHLFTHCHNLGTDPDLLLREIEHVLSYLQGERKRKRIEAVNVRELVERSCKSKGDYA